MGLQEELRSIKFDLDFSKMLHPLLLLQYQSFLLSKLILLESPEEISTEQFHSHERRLGLLTFL